MKRRTLIAGLGTLISGSVFAVGSGAFTSVTANRQLQVETARDNNARLSLTELGGGERSEQDRGKVEFSFPGDDEDQSLGLGTDSVYEFDQDADEADYNNPIKGLLRIENQGTQPVNVYSMHQTDSELEIEIYDVTDNDRVALRDDPVMLDVGEHVDTGFRIRTFDADIGSFDESLTIVAEAPDN